MNLLHCTSTLSGKISSAFPRSVKYSKSSVKATAAKSSDAKSNIQQCSTYFTDVSTSRRLLISALPLLTLVKDSTVVADEIPAIDEDEEAAFASELAALVPKGASKVFVAGATGQTGRRVVLELRRRQVAVRAGVRDVKKAQSLGLAVSTPGTSAGPVELVKFDVTSDQAALIEAIGDADAVICATGFTPTLQNLGGLKPGAANAVDRLGTINLVAAAKSAGVNQFVLVTSLLTNAVESGQGDNQNYKVLNAFGGVLDAKHDAELNLRASGLTYTIVRPGGLSNEPPSGELIVSGEDTLFGTDNESGREISRDQVAEICVEALFQGAADNKVIEIVSSPTAPQLDRSAWFDV